MEFKDRFYNLDQFLATEFPDADLEGLNDKQVVNRYVRMFWDEVYPEHLKIIILEIGEVIPQIAKYLGDISESSNRYLPTPEDGIEWLTMVRTELEKHLKDNATSK